MGLVFYLLSTGSVSSEGNFFSSGDSDHMGLLAVYLLAESADPSLAGQIALRDQSVGKLRIAKAKKSPLISSRFSVGPNNDLKNQIKKSLKSLNLLFKILMSMKRS